MVCPAGRVPQSNYEFGLGGCPLGQGVLSRYARVVCLLAIYYGASKMRMRIAKRSIR